jgi:anti-sigma-K factor RskA
MKLDQIIEKLLSTARKDQPSDRVPYAFEKRIMAQIADLPSADDLWAAWSRLLWRAVAPCAAVAVLTVVVWVSVSPAQPDRAMLDPELEEIVAMAIELPAE